MLLNVLNYFCKPHLNYLTNHFNQRAINFTRYEHR